MIKISGIGGVQSQFELFFNNLSHRAKKNNFILNIGVIDSHYNSLQNNGGSFLRKLVAYLFEKNSIIHSYNNLTSRKYLLLFSILKPKFLIFHERGNAWNLSSHKKEIVIGNARVAKRTICNSKASMILLHQKFGVDLGKMTVIYNGVISDAMIKKSLSLRNKYVHKEKYVIGYVGRLDTNKGVQSLIESMCHLDQDIFELHIIGNGDLSDEYKIYSEELNIKSIKFFGRIKKAWEKMPGFDVLVVPSIREPLGNVIIEAALSRVPVIASMVDGIPEIIKEKYSGILIKPSISVDKRFVSMSVPLPECVVDVNSNRLEQPMQLDPLLLSSAIKFMHNNKVSSELFAENLYNDVINKFSVGGYIDKLFSEYKSVLKNGQ